MTTNDNNSVSKLQQTQDQLTFIAQHLKSIQTSLDGVKLESKKAEQRLNELLPALESAIRDIAWKDASVSVDTFAPLATPQDIVRAFRVLSSGSLPTASPETLMASLKGSATAPTSPQEARPLAVLDGLDLTSQARMLLKTGKSYNQVIDALLPLHPGRTREQIRRAVGRANGGAR